jgi:predicted MFS family arabinose efflux permease
LFALVGAGAVAEIDAATFLIAVMCLLALRISEQRPERLSPADGGGRLTAGFRFIAREPALRTITLALGLAMLAFGFTESAGFSVVTVGLHHNATFVGVLMAVQGVGGVAGGLCAAAILRRVSEGMMTAMGLASAGIAVLLLTVPDIAVVVAGMLLAGFVGPWVSVAAITAIQRRTPADLLGRVSGAFGLSLTVPQVASVGLGAALIAVLNYRILLLAVAAVAAASVLFLLSQPQARHRLASVEPEPDKVPA